MNIKQFLLALCIGLLIPVGVFAQAGQGTIQGYINDPSGTSILCRRRCGWGSTWRGCGTFVRYHCV
jgi:hypothetical protein